MLYQGLKSICVLLWKNQLMETCEIGKTLVKELIYQLLAEIESILSVW